MFAKVGMISLIIVVIAVGVFTLYSCSGSKTALGIEREDKKARSPQWNGSKFVNGLERVDGSFWKMTKLWLFDNDNKFKSPQGDDTVQYIEVDPEVFKKNPESGLRVTWMGHSTLLIEIDGYTVLTDPVWSKRCSPVSFAGPSRFFAPPLPLSELPKIDAIIISHDHYDHLDKATIEAMKEQVELFAVPLGVGKHLEEWGVDASKISEIDWWEEIRVGELTLTATPARHFSGRSVGSIFGAPTLWSGWAVKGSQHNIYYSGDTAMFPGLYEIGDRLGPFDITFIESGAYNTLWADVHIGPEQAVLAHKMLKGKVMMPIHWGTFDLALHNWTEPAERIMVAAKKEGVTAVIPKPGRSFQLTDSLELTQWWPEVEWKTAEESPLVSSGLDSNIYDRLRIIEEQIVMGRDSTIVDSLLME